MAFNTTSLAQWYPDELLPHPQAPRLFFLYNKTSESGYLEFALEPKQYYETESYFAHEWVEEYSSHVWTLILEPNENVTLTARNIRDRIFVPEIETEIIMTLDFSFIGESSLAFQLRFDGDGDGIFEYVLDFLETAIDGPLMRLKPESITGEPAKMTDGTIEFEIMRIDDSQDVPPTISIYCRYMYTWIDVPFDLDTDNDNIGDLSDPDDDNDGYPDEWRDSDDDGIGDNADDDDNGNGISDDLEIPIVMGIVLVPFVIILAVMNKMKKKGKEEEETEWGDEDIPILTTPHEGPKNW